MGIKAASKGFLIIAGVAALALSGCSGEKKQESAQAPAMAPASPAAPGAPGAGPDALPEGHPAINPEAKVAQDITKAAHSNIKTQKEIKLTDDVKSKWKEVKLEVTDGASKTKEVLTLKIGSTVPLKKPGFKLKVEVLVPDYAIADNKILSRSNEPRNPAVLVDLIEGEKSVARGWVFKEFPEFNSYTDDRFLLSLVAPGVEKPAKK